MSASPAGTRWPATTLVMLAAAALLLRLPQLGNPLADIDEQFYLLVGDRLLHGALPYVDIWDRKPIGLFLLFAGIRLLGGDGIVQYQLVAGLFALATAATVVAIARRLTGAVGAAAGGLAYLVWLNLLGGGTGQSPVFYNLFTALAALALFRAAEATDPRAVRRSGWAAMAAIGVALQLKPTVLFEGCLFGLAFLHLAGTRGAKPAALARFAAELIAIALAPTLAAFAAYAIVGHGQDFWFANVGSILHRVSPPNAHPGAKLGGIALVLLPLAAAAGLAMVAGRDAGGPAARLPALWLGAAILGFLLVPPYYNHYALPLLAPLAVAAAPALGRRAVLPAAALVGALLLWLSGWPGFERARVGRERTAQLSTLVAGHLHGGCLFVFQGPPVLYLTTHACAVSRFVFPAHLNYLGEAKAIGVDPGAEAARAMAARPAVIVTSRRDAIVDPNPATWDVVEAAIRRDYRLVGTGVADRRTLGVYALKDR